MERGYNVDPSAPVGIAVDIVVLPTDTGPKKFVRVVLETAVGTSYMFFDPDNAENVGKMIKATARQAKLNLELPKGLTLADLDDDDDAIIPISPEVKQQMNKEKE